MRISTVSYTKVYPLGQYTNEKICVELVVEKGDNAKQALQEAKSLADEFHRENLKNIPEIGFEEPAEIIQTQSPKSLAEKTKEFINDCTTVEELKAWEFMAKTKVELKEYYDNKLLQLK
jgi:hypothetical protein